MKLGFVVKQGSTGVWRYTERLISGLRELGDFEKIKVFYRKPEESEVLAIYRKNESYVEPVLLRATETAGDKKDITSGWLRDWLPGARRHSDKDKFLMEQCDLLFFPSTFYENVPCVDRPLCFITHDFAYSRNFGTWNWFSLDDFEIQRARDRGWFSVGKCVASCNFVRDEVVRLFGIKNSPRVVRLASLSSLGRLPDAEAEDRVRRIGITRPFILCANNLCVHKNLGQLLGAFSLIPQRLADLSLVLTGTFSSSVSGVSDFDFGLALDRDPKRNRVCGLGHVSDEDLVSLIQLAEVVVNPSLNEAGNGSGADAWAVGSPVAMSDIPPFREHLDFLGVKASLFNPRSVFSVLEGLLWPIDHKEKAVEDALVSKMRIGEWTWKHIAHEYCEFFSDARKA